MPANTPADSIHSERVNQGEDHYLVCRNQPQAPEDTMTPLMDDVTCKVCIIMLISFAVAILQG